MGNQTTVTVGVDTHADVHVAAVLDQTGRMLDARSFPTTTRGYAQLATWAESFGSVDKVGLEGAGSCGSGLLRFLTEYEGCLALSATPSIITAIFHHGMRSSVTAAAAVRPHEFLVTASTRGSTKRARPSRRGDLELR